MPSDDESKTVASTFLILTQTAAISQYILPNKHGWTVPVFNPKP